MWLAVCVTVAASTANNVGKALQKEATRTLPRFTLSYKVLWQYAGSSAYVTGLAADLAGALAMIGAFALAPVSLVQPVSGLGLVTLSIFSHVYLKERLSAGEWSAAGVALLGTVGVGVTQEDSPDAVLPTLWRVLLVMLCLAGGTCALSLFHWSGRPAGPRRPQSAAVGGGGGQKKPGAAVYGLQAGGFFGLSAAACRLGFVAGRQKTWVAAPLGLLSSVGLTSTGLMLQTIGLKDGNTVVVCTCAAVASIVMGVLVGVLALNEGFPSTPGLAVLRLLSWVLLALGVSALASGHGGAKRVLYVALKSIPQSLLQRLPQRTALGIRQLSQQLRAPGELPT